MTAAARVSCVEDGIAELIHGVVYDSHEVIFGDPCFQIQWQKELTHGILNVQRNCSFRKRWFALPFYQETVSFCCTSLRKGMSRHFYTYGTSPFDLYNLLTLW